MPQYKMLLVELYVELLRRSCERERFSYYARMGTFMEKRETRDESLMNEFMLLFKKELIIKGVWEYDDKYDIDDCFSGPPFKALIDCKNKNATKDNYSRLEHFEDCIKVYQGKNRLKMSDKDIEQIEDYFKENYKEHEIITRHDLEKVCKVLGKKSIKGNENALLMRINPSALDDISDLEDELINDFKAFSKEYDVLAKGELVRKKFLYSQFVLFHLLRRRGHDCNPENFKMIRTKSGKKTHNDICRLVFERLGWEFEEI